MHVPFAIPRLDPETSPWRNSLLGRRRILNAEIGSTPVAFEFQSGILSRPEQFLKVKMGEAVLWIGVHDLDRLPIAEELGVAGISRLPKQIVLGVLETLLDDVIQAVGSNVGSVCHIEDIVPAESVNDELHRIGIRLSGEGRSSVFGCVACESSSLALLADLVSRQPTTESIDREPLPIPFQLEIGETPIPLSDLKRLRRQDVLMLENAIGPERDQAIARFPAPLPAWRVRLNGESVEFQEPLATSNPEPAEDAVRVRFQRGIHSLSVAKLSELTFGLTVQIETNYRVTLVLGESPFASGELVSFSQRIGVRLLDFISPAGELKAV
jgi:flagellar motor switch/type III secretory pathway protein FliN